MNHRQSTIQNTKKLLGDRWWRLNNLYYIIDRDANRVRFKPNKTQERLFKNRWYRNVILKSRQHGITTFICILYLDACLFNENKTAAIIAHTLPDANRIFETKIKYAYDNLPDEIRATITAKTDRAGELKFSNNSRIYVTTSTRGGTLNLLHVSELGTIAMKAPDKAKEILTGSIPSVHEGNVIFVESTADGGANGEFYEMCKSAEDKQLSGEKLSKLDFKFHFFSWHDDDHNRIDPSNVTIPARLEEYFAMLKNEHAISLDPWQKAWYCVTSDILQDEMTVQHPSYADEAFQSAVDGSYYRNQTRTIRESNRLCEVPYRKGVLVNTAWDIGVNDQTAIWFYQCIGRKIHVIDYFAAYNQGFDFFADILMKRGYHYGRHVGPHDLNVREWGNKGITRLDSARNAGIKFNTCPSIPKADGIDAVRNVLGLCWFDKERCGEGFEMLERYKKEWDTRLGTFKNTPLHDDASDAADAFRYLAIDYMRRDYRTLGLDGETARPNMEVASKKYTYI